jgi:hypothetical protein
LQLAGLQLAGLQLAGLQFAGLQFAGPQLAGLQLTGWHQLGMLGRVLLEVLACAASGLCCAQVASFLAFFFPEGGGVVARAYPAKIINARIQDLISRFFIVEGF